LLLGIVDNVIETILEEQKSGVFTGGFEAVSNRGKLRSAGNSRLQFLFSREAQEANNELTFQSKSNENHN